MTQPRSRLRGPSLFALVLSALLIQATSPATAEEPFSPADVTGPQAWGSAENVTQLRHLFFADQPDAAGFAAAREAGVAVVIDLRAPGERDWDEAAVVAGLGMTYHNVPISGAYFEPEAIARIESLVKQSGQQKILIHCSSSNRAGGWLAVHLAEQHGLDEASALAIGRRAGITKDAIEARVHEHLVGQRARQALAPLKKGLMGALKGAMAEGPEAALQTCQLAAPSITQGAQAASVAVGRTSDRTRNPANAPAAWMQPLLAHYREAPAAGRAPRVVDLGEAGTGYVEPIYLKEMCTTCHGSRVEPELLGAIHAAYPEDRAVGFEVGDLRGLFWVVLSPES